MSLSPTMLRKFTRQDRLLFIHIGKTGGRTLEKILEGRFDPSEICPAYLGEEFQAIPPEDRARYRLFRGHFVHGLIDLVPGSPIVLTMLREPVSRAISNYQHILLDSRHSLHGEFVDNDVSLYEFATNPEYNADISNWMTLALGGTLDIDVAKQRLRDDYAFVGITERFRDSMHLLSHTLGWAPILEIDKINVTPNRLRRESLSETTIEAIEKQGNLDIELYEYALELFNDRFQAMLQSLLTSWHDMESSKSRSLSELAEMRAELARAKDEIDLMRSTRGWRALEVWWSIKRRIFPPATKGQD